MRQPPRQRSDVAGIGYRRGARERSISASCIPWLCVHGFASKTDKEKVELAESSLCHFSTQPTQGVFKELPRWFACADTDAGGKPVQFRYFTKQYM